MLEYESDEGPGTSTEEDFIEDTRETDLIADEQRLTEDRATPTPRPFSSRSRKSFTNIFLRYPLLVRISK